VQRSGQVTGPFPPPVRPALRIGRLGVTHGVGIPIGSSRPRTRLECPCETTYASICNNLIDRVRNLAVFNQGTHVLAAVLVAVALAGCSGKGAPLPRLAEDDVIVAFGDSLTYGTGAEAKASYPAVLAQLIGRKVIRAGVPGEVTAQGRARLASVIEEYNPRLVIVCLGGNDMLRRVSEQEIKRNLRAMLADIERHGIAAVLIGVPKPALLTSAPEFYAELAAEFNIPYEGEVVTNVLYKSEYKSDAIHPNAQGYRKIAEAIAELLRKSGAV
jgi:acyl-CoA thioesterase-1